MSDGSLACKRIVVQGVGHVGEYLVRLVTREKAKVFISDINQDQLNAVVKNYNSEVISPDEYTGSVTGDLNRRRGIMKGMDTRGGAQVIKADVPLSELFGYVTDLRTITSGRASATLTFAHYAPVPKNLAEKVIDEVKGAVATK